MGSKATTTNFNFDLTAKFFFIYRTLSMRQKTKNERNQVSNDKKCNFLVQSPSRLSRWVRLVQNRETTDWGVYVRVQWFLLFFTFWGITTHPWHPKGPRIWKLATKNFQLHPWPAEIFGKNRKMRFLGLVSKFRAPFDRSLPFFQHILFMESLINI